METNQFFAVLFLIANLVVFLLKDTNKFCAGVWFVLKSFWIALFAVLAFGYIKSQLKKR